MVGSDAIQGFHIAALDANIFVQGLFKHGQYPCHATVVSCLSGFHIAQFALVSERVKRLFGLSKRDFEVDVVIGISCMQN